jgi:hypothetical protein
MDASVAITPNSEHRTGSIRNLSVNQPQSASYAGRSGLANFCSVEAAGNR